MSKENKTHINTPVGLILMMTALLSACGPRAVVMCPDGQEAMIFDPTEWKKITNESYEHESVFARQQFDVGDTHFRYWNPYLYNLQGGGLDEYMPGSWTTAQGVHHIERPSSSSVLKGTLTFNEEQIIFCRNAKIQGATQEP